MPEHRCERPPDELPDDRRCRGSGRSSGVAPSISLTIGQRCPDYSAQRLVAGAFTGNYRRGPRLRLPSAKRIGLLPQDSKYNF